jgi:hypothetical protein
VEVIKGFQFLETRRGILFLILEVQNMFASMILVANHQLRFGKNLNPCGNTQRMTISIGEMLAKKKGFERDNQKILPLLLYIELPKPSWCNAGLNLTLKYVATSSPCCC